MIKPLKAKSEAEWLLSTWKKRGATVARVLNPDGEEIFSLHRDDESAERKDDS